MVARNQWNWKYKNNLKPTWIKVSSDIKSKWSDQRPNNQRTFVSKKNNYYKPVKVGKFYGNNYSWNKSNGDKDKTQSFKRYFDEINNLKISGTWKIQSAMTINFVSSIDT